MSESESKWSEERLYVLRTIDDLKTQARKQAEETAADRAALIERGARDIGAAHDKIRALERGATSLRLKNWIMALALGGAGAIALEFVKEMLKGWFHK